VRYSELVVDRLVAPRSKLGFVRALNEQTACSSLGAPWAEREVYEALDWLVAQQTRIENGLARRHLKDGALVLYDVSSSYLEGHKCELARRGYSRPPADRLWAVVYARRPAGRGVRRQHRRPEDAGRAGQETHRALQAGAHRAGRGHDHQRAHPRGSQAGLDWITGLRAPAILARDDGPLQLSLFDERNMAEISAPEQFPDERLIVCRNPLLADERARKREELLAATERALSRVDMGVRRNRPGLRTAAEIGVAVGAVVDRHKMAKHFELDIRDGHLSWRRGPESIAREARLDGVYVVRTSVPAEVLDAGQTVRAYKDLARVERAFRCLKSVELEIRPVRHWVAPRVRAHVFVCMLAYHVEWHLRQALAPLLFHDTDIEAARTARGCPVSKAEPSQAALDKKATKRTPAGLPVLGFADLLRHLGTLTRNTMRAALQSVHTFTLYPRQTPGGCLHAARHRPRTCPVTENACRKKLRRINALRFSQVKTPV
jgi:hypothetical protein